MRLAKLSVDILALMAMSLACDLTTFVMPLIVGALASQHGLSDAAVGFLATGQLMATALLSFALAPRVRQLNPRMALMLGLILVAAGNAVTLVAHQALVLTAARLSAGLGEALVTVITGVVVAAKPNPDNGFAMISIGITTGAVAVFFLAPVLSPWTGQDAIFWILAALPAVMLPFVFAIQTRPLDGADARATSLRETFAVGASGAAMLTAVVGFGIAGNAIFIFVERIGEGVGVGYSALVQMLLWATVWTAAGSYVARMIGSRVSRMTILIISFLGVAVADPLMGAPANAGVLFLGLNMGGFFLLLAQPFYCGLMVAMDPRGRLITLSRGVLAVGSAITPSIASVMLLAGGGFPAMGYLSAVICLVSLGLLLYAGRSIGWRKPRLQLTPSAPPLGRWLE